MLFVGEAEELIESSHAGVIVPPDEPEKFASAVLAMFENPKAAREMGLCGLAYVHEKFEWTMLVRNWLEQLRRATATRDAAAPEFKAVQSRVPKAS